MTTYLEHIASGGIVAGVAYQVYETISGDSVTYNGNTYTNGQFFTGVDGVTDYTVSGSPIVVVSSSYVASDIGVKVPYLDKYTDDSYFKSTSIGSIEDYYLSKFTDESWFKGVVIGLASEIEPINKVSNIRTFPETLTGKQLLTEQNM